MIYFDNAATTQLDPEVLNILFKSEQSIYANASSTHALGKTARKYIEIAREQVAYTISCKSDQIIFTSGATEAINTILKGLYISNSDEKNHIITSKTEHKAVLDTCRFLEDMGADITYLDVDTDGLINFNELVQCIRPETLLVSIMYANNETGVIQPIEQIGRICKEKKVLFMTDATQAIGKIDIDVARDHIDLLCMSSHKLHGPKGVGAFYMSGKIELSPLLHGGGQEDSYRAGTYNTSGIIGFGKACEISIKQLDSINAKVRLLQESLEDKLLKIEGAWVNSKNSLRLPNITNIGFKNINSEVLLKLLEDDLAISTGSACTTKIVEPSHVLKSMGLSTDDAHSCLRISLSKFSTDDEVRKVVELITNSVSKLRKGN